MAKKKESKKEKFTGTFTFKESRVPYRCPVCGGNGLVQNGFYNQVIGEWSSTTATPEVCRSCNGTGIVWG